MKGYLLLVLFAASGIQSAVAQPCPASVPVEAGPWRGPKLIEAVNNSDADAVRALIAAGVPLNERDNQGNTPLVASLTPRAPLEIPGIVPQKDRERDIQQEFSAQSIIMSLLLAKGADPNAPGAHGRTPLMQVAAWGHGRAWDLRTAEMLLSHGARVDEEDVFGNTALILATERGKADIVRLLADHGASPIQKNCHGESAISIARAKKFIELVRVLEREAENTPR